MSAINAIPVRAEYETGNVRPLLHEIRHALRSLQGGGEGTAIDLRSLPLAPGEERRIEEALGVGEVRVELDALGPSTITETSYPGVWLITHRNTENEVIGRLIEVTRVPALLASQPEDIAAGLERLERDLDDGGQQGSN
ncbi:MAG: hydrogenase expression/formation protein [Gammaproteobacteria bacterium]|nr:hydrogenase expression/formation protein [Gammaproteobacteria bacterium]